MTLFLGIVLFGTLSGLLGLLAAALFITICQFISEWLERRHQ